MESDFDEGSFKKARSFLMVFSTMLLVLWYFKAEMGTISLLGNSIKFTANAHNLWLVLAVANLYFFCRYVQHLPENWRKPGKSFDDLFDLTLCRVTETFYRRNLRDHAWAHFRDDNAIDGVKNFKIKPSASRLRMSDESLGFFPSLPPTIRVDFSLPYTWTQGNRDFSSTGSGLAITPHKLVILYSRVSAFIKGVFLAPWFTEHLFPLLYAFCAITVGGWSWVTAHTTVAVSLPTKAELTHTAYVPGNPQVIKCVSEIIRTKQSLLSAACVPEPAIAPLKRLTQNNL